MNYSTYTTWKNIQYTQYFVQPDYFKTGLDFIDQTYTGLD